MISLDNYRNIDARTNTSDKYGDNILEKGLLSPILQSILDSVYDGVIIVDKNLLIKKINSAVLKIFKIQKEALYKIHLDEICIGDSLHSILTKKQKILDADYTFFINDKKIRCVVNIVPINVNGTIHGFIFLVKDTKKLHKIVNNVVGYKASFTFDDIVTRSENMKDIIRLAKKASRTDCSILIEGNSGTGKELFAQSIHNYSKRHLGPFVAVNCAAIPRELVESELFGYEKGAFTGASKGGYPGKFELADGGTVFLDEIGELPIDVQSKLLRFLDNLKLVRVGGTYEKSIDIRIIAATNKLLEKEVKSKNFRGDLYYRLNVMKLHLPPLNKRLEDVEPLVQYFINKLNIKNSGHPKYADYGYIEKLKLHKFNGNIRELRNIVERSYYLCEDTTITDKYLIYQDISLNHEINQCKNKTILSLDEIEKLYIKNALKHFHGNAPKAAKALKIGKATIYRKIKKFNIDLSIFD
ncbi:sigma-54 interaction domain-containing protein [Clostridium sp. LBM24168]